MERTDFSSFQEEPSPPNRRRASEFRADVPWEPLALGMDAERGPVALRVTNQGGFIADFVQQPFAIEQLPTVQVSLFSVTG